MISTLLFAVGLSLPVMVVLVTAGLTLQGSVVLPRLGVDRAQVRGSSLARAA